MLFSILVRLTMHHKALKETNHDKPHTGNLKSNFYKKTVCTDPPRLGWVFCIIWMTERILNYYKWKLLTNQFKIFRDYE